MSNMQEVLSKNSNRSGFTLIELSIVLVIIGLIVGGVLVGQDLIRAAQIRAQITQIERFNTAVNTFFGKFQALPGDMNYSTAISYGFTNHTGSTSTAGQGNGDGIIDTSLGPYTTPPMTYTSTENVQSGETMAFWVDLSSAAGGNLIEGGFTVGALTGFNVGWTTATLSRYLPVAKLGGGNFVHVTEINGVNYYGVDVAKVASPGLPYITATAGMTVYQAYSIDKKIDDGFPTTGNVFTMVDSTYPEWVMGGPTGTWDSYVPAGSTFSGIAATAGNTPDSTTCFDAAVGVTANYTLEINNGAGLNCALMFKMQGGD
jgi:prepilin-type N-terminal cleavage/methylation domain-containing protein